MESLRSSVLPALVVSFLSVCIFIHAESPEAFPGRQALDPALSWIKAERIKASYTWMGATVHPYPESVVQDLKMAGFNAMFLKDSKDEKRNALWFDAAERHGMKVFVCFNFWSIPDSGKVPDAMDVFRKAVYKDGKESLAPCPLNSEYWDRMLLPGQLEMAKLSLRRKCVAGIMLDTEMYGIKPHAFLDDVCFCDSCFGSFLRGLGKTADGPVARDRRYAWLKEGALLKAYYAFLEKGQQEICDKFRANVQRVNPSLALGNFNFVNTWFFRGLAKGFGTESAPAILCPESPTYDEGYTPFVERQKEMFRTEGFHVFYVPGVFNKSFFPDDLARNSYKLAVNADGYYDFTVRALYGLIGEFNRDLARKSRGDFSKYWDAFKYANAEISRKALSRDGYVSPLDAEPVNLVDGNRIVHSSPQFSETELSAFGRECGENGKGRPLKCDVSGDNGKAVFIVDFEKPVSFNRVAALCKGGGVESVYFPVRIEAYGCNALGDESSWEFLGLASEPDIAFSFPEDGLHTNKSKWITIPLEHAVKFRYAKLAFHKLPDSEARKLAKKESSSSKTIEIERISITSR